jgi:hypothetical protein
MVDLGYNEDVLLSRLHATQRQLITYIVLLAIMQIDIHLSLSLPLIVFDHPGYSCIPKKG